MAEQLHMASTYPEAEIQLHSRGSRPSPIPAPSIHPAPDDVLLSPPRRQQALLLLAGFMMIFHIIGINTSFGIFQARPDFYTSDGSNIPSARKNDALVSLVGTIGSGLTWSGGIFVNPIMARFENVKLITFIGTAVMSLGLLLASYSSTLWQLFLTQGLLYGLGSSFYYFPIMSIAPAYFDRHRGFAMGCILSGAGVGGLVMAPVLQVLLDRYGVHTALRILAAWNFAIGLPVAAVVRRRGAFNRSADAARTRVNMALVKRRTFVYQALGALFQAAGNVIPLYYMTSYAVSVLSYSRSTGSLLLAVNSGVNSVARIAMGILADSVGRQNTLICGALLSSLAVFALWYDAARERFIAFVVVYGIYAGGYNALIPTTITEIYGVENYARVNGSIYFVRGLGSLLGAPIAGLILGSHTRGGTAPGADLRARFDRVVVYDGALLLCASLCVAYVRWLDARDKGVWRWKA
ncbi:major facilitator superfamily domain-containing protein [Mycena pura]|uniref:Major facilitator superfamily domain-containing protein n=1 Tax=Mycena pura TaxID=153505 RepID=A0AAD6Y2E9_9AGAR|nr:major facilitator superfamily domain-containing protein [Mycena pura]